jgi:hypothetical protein
MGTGNLAFFNDIPISENPSFPKKKSFTALPEGAKTGKPRATPWDAVRECNGRPERAKQGRAATRCFALSGRSTNCGVLKPRALPWADMFPPLRGEEPQNAQLQKA